MEWIRFCYLDTSALLKLVVNEPESGILEQFLRTEVGTAFHTTWLCVAEAFGVLRCEWLKELKGCLTARDKAATTGKYLVAADTLRGYIVQKLVDISNVTITDAAIFTQT